MRSLLLLVFTAGFVTLGVELSASRLLEPAFGNNQIVWAALIGMILLYLALGAWLGGRLADRFPTRRALDLSLTLAALGVAAIPLFSRPVLRMASGGMESFAPGLLAGALLAVLILFSVPVLLLGTASPWAARLRLLEQGADVDPLHTGQTLGTLYALGTAGSLLGAFVPVLFLIPAIGTRLTFMALALALLVVVTVGALGRRHLWAPALALVAVALLTLFTASDRSIRAAWDDGSRGAILFEDESLFNYIAVRQWGSERHLKLNDGIGIHSVYHPDSVLSNGIWDYFLLAPLVRPVADEQVAPESLLVIGLAAGTVTGLYDDIYGALGAPVQMTGVELDAEILDVGREYFEMERPTLNAVAADGRRWLAQQPPDARWDVIAVDAYRPPYIPFHLTTVEFFGLVRDHLSDDGVLAINIGRTQSNLALVDALAATVGSLFPTVLLFDEPGPPGSLANTLLVATRAQVTPDDVAARIAALPDAIAPEFRTFAEASLQVLRPAPPSSTVPFTDDHAPVERVVHGIVLDYLAGN
jgi:spermidine synthase